MTAMRSCSLTTACIRNAKGVDVMVQKSLAGCRESFIGDDSLRSKIKHLRSMPHCVIR